jgi:hypothetical protein
MTLDDQYLRRLDSLARYYNSQITAHVGYMISVIWNTFQKASRPGGFDEMKISSP